MPVTLKLVVQGIIALGIMLLVATLTATPLMYVVASLVTFLRQRDLVFVGIGLALVVMLSTK